MRGRAWTCVILAAVVAAASFHLLGAEGEKAREALDALFGRQLETARKTRDGADDVALAAKMLETAGQTTDQPALLALLCETACELASADPSGFETALASADLLATNLPEKAAGGREIILGIRRRQYERSRGKPHQEAGEAYAEALLEAAAAQARTGDLDEALRNCRQARTIARAVRSEKAGLAEADLKRLAALKRSADRTEALKKQLAADPSNRKARDDLVCLLLVDLDRPAEAATFLDKGCNPTFRKFIPGAAKPVDEAPELACLQLGDWYRELADGAAPAGKPAMLARAQAYYDRFLSLHKPHDLDRKKAQLLLRQVMEQLAELGGAPTAEARWINLLNLVDLKRHVVRGKWERPGDALYCDNKSVAHCVMPVVPLGDYEFEFQYRYRLGGAVHAIFPTGRKGAVVKIFPHSREGFVELDIADQRGYTLPKPKAPSGATIRIRVRTRGKRVAIAITAGGEPFLGWTGPDSSLGVPVPWALPDKRCIGLGAYNGGVEFKNIRLRMLSGRAVLFRKP